MKPIYIQCDCHTPYHCLCFERDPDIAESLVVSFVSTRNGFFWHRVKWAFLHIFRREDLVFADIIIKRAQLADVLKALEDESK